MEIYVRVHKILQMVAYGALVLKNKVNYISLKQ